MVVVVVVVVVVVLVCMCVCVCMCELLQSMATQVKEQMDRKYGVSVPCGCGWSRGGGRIDVCVCRSAALMALHHWQGIWI